MQNPWASILAALGLLLVAAESLAAEAIAEPPTAPKRVYWHSRVIGTPEPPLPYRTVPAFAGLSFKRPLYIAAEPGSNRLLVVEQGGKILAFENRPGVHEAETFLEIPDHDTYSLCFHPQYEQTGQVFVFSNGPNSEKRKQNRIVRYTVGKEQPRRVDPATRHLIIEYESNGHNGGEMAFGPDGYLYISSGDGTSDSDGDLTGQDISDLVSGVLRLNVEQPDEGRGYSVPKDNPFLHLPDARPELWAYGFRNPWRLCFDRRTGDLWVGDIGQDLWELVHVVQRGANYGWSVNEGSRPFQPLRKRGPTPISPPTIEHPHSEARSITGGLVYYGERFADLRGAYFYGDYATGKIWAARYSDGKVTWQKDLADTSLQILAFADDQAGQVLLVDYVGHIHRLEPAPPVVRNIAFPRKLSDTGLFADVAKHVPHPALVGYDVNSPLWSDGAAKERFIALPGLTSMEFTERGAWKFPEGAVLVKTFSLDSPAGKASSARRIETRLMVFQQNEWVGYSYRWNDEQTDAELVPAAGADVPYTVRDANSPAGQQQTWRFPSRAECMVCHTRAAQYVLGPQTLQMNRDHDYGGTRSNQIEWLARQGYLRTSKREPPAAYETASKAWRGRFEAASKSLPKKLPKFWQPLAIKEAQPLLGIVRTVWNAVDKQVAAERDRSTVASFLLPKSLEQLGHLADPYDMAADLNERARSYLHSNCSHCHVEAGGGNAAINLSIATTPENMRTMGVSPLHDRFGISGAELIAPGEPARSVLLHRVSKLGPGRMPPLGSGVVDEPASRMLEAWIKQLEPPTKD